MKMQRARKRCHLPLCQWRPSNVLASNRICLASSSTLTSTSSSTLSFLVLSYTKRFEAICFYRTGDKRRTHICQMRKFSLSLSLFFRFFRCDSFRLTRIRLTHMHGAKQCKTTTTKSQNKNSKYKFTQIVFVSRLAHRASFHSMATILPCDVRRIVFVFGARRAGSRANIF